MNWIHLLENKLNIKHYYRCLNWELSFYAANMSIIGCKTVSIRAYHSVYCGVTFCHSNHGRVPGACGIGESAHVSWLLDFCQPTESVVSIDVNRFHLYFIQLSKCQCSQFVLLWSSERTICVFFSAIIWFDTMSITSDQLKREKKMFNIWNRAEMIFGCQWRHPELKHTQCRFQIVRWLHL